MCSPNRGTNRHRGEKPASTASAATAMGPCPGQVWDWPPSPQLHSLGSGGGARMSESCCGASPHRAARSHALSFGERARALLWHELQVGVRMKRLHATPPLVAARRKAWRRGRRLRNSYEQAEIEVEDDRPVNQERERQNREEDVAEVLQAVEVGHFWHRCFNCSNHRST
jgi:hypothetical protein